MSLNEQCASALWEDFAESVRRVWDRPNDERAIILRKLHEEAFYAYANGEYTLQ